MESGWVHPFTACGRTPRRTEFELQQSENKASPFPGKKTPECLFKKQSLGLLGPLERCHHYERPCSQLASCAQQSLMMLTGHISCTNGLMFYLFRCLFDIAQPQRIYGFGNNWVLSLHTMMLSPTTKEMRDRKGLDSLQIAFTVYNKNSNTTKGIRQRLKHKSTVSSMIDCKEISGTKSLSLSTTSTQRQLNNVTASALFPNRG